MDEQNDLSKHLTTTLSLQEDMFFSDLNSRILNFITENFMNFDREAIEEVSDELKKSYGINIRDPKLDKEYGLITITNICRYISEKLQDTARDVEKMSQSLQEMEKETGACIEASTEIGRSLLHKKNVVGFLNSIELHFETWRQRVAFQIEKRSRELKPSLSRQHKFRR